MTKLKYEEITDHIKNKILTCQLCPGDILPSESSLCKTFNMSRVSVRKGLSVLTAEEYITPVPGKGYFVNKPKEERCMLCFYEPAFLDQYTDRFEQVEIKIIRASGKIPGRLEIEEGAPVIYVKNLYFSGKEAVAYDIKYFPKADTEISNDPKTYVNSSDHCNNYFCHTKKEMHIWAAITTEEERVLFGINEAVPTLVIEQTHRDINNIVVSWSRLFIIKKYNLIAKS